MSSAAEVLTQLTATSRRLALVGLAKNTGKTETLNALLRELQASGRRVGVTSVGRDGEEHDVIDARIVKPRIELPSATLVATTDELLRASGIPHEVLERTAMRTPLGEVLIASLSGRGAIEIAGPSGAEQIRAASDMMLSHGAEQVLIDGAIDRRAASSPDVADALVMATGAILSADIEEVVAHTKHAVDLASLPLVEESSRGGALGQALAELEHNAKSSLLSAQGDIFPLPPRFALSGDISGLSQRLCDGQQASWLLIAGAVPDKFLRELLLVIRPRKDELRVLVGDPTKVFLADKGVAWYRRQGIRLEVLRSTELCALTVNPVAPQAHRFDSLTLRKRISEVIPSIPVLDVLQPA